VHWFGCPPHETHRHRKTGRQPHTPVHVGVSPRLREQLVDFIAAGVVGVLVGFLRMMCVFLRETVTTTTTITTTITRTTTTTELSVFNTRAVLRRESNIGAGSI
jgi:hypothetical protein